MSGTAYDASKPPVGTNSNRRASLDNKSRRNSVELSGQSIMRRPTGDLESGSPDEALQELMDGNMRFILGQSSHPHQTFDRLQKIQPKQKPIAAILGCADSRVPTEILFDQGFGDVFVCRIAGNIASPEEIASLEYAVLELGVKVIMVLGHTSCGAVKAALSGKAFPGFIDMLVDSLDVAVARTRTRAVHESESWDQFQERCRCLDRHDGHPDAKTINEVARENVRYQIYRCKRSTIILEAFKNKKCLVQGAMYNLDTGEVELVD